MYQEGEEGEEEQEQEEEAAAAAQPEPISFIIAYSSLFKQIMTLCDLHIL